MRYLLILLLCALPLAALTSEQLVNEILKNPGYYQQNCRGPAPVPAGEVPLFGYRRSWSDEKISEANFVKLRDQRKGVLIYVAAQLADLNLQKAEKDPHRAEMLLMMVLDLNGVEALSALLTLEKRLDKRAYYRLDKPKPGSESKYSLHVQVLSTITAILKNEHVDGLAQLGQKATYDLKTRNLIVGLGDKFLQNVETTEWRRGAAMASQPGLR